MIDSHAHLDKVQAALGLSSQDAVVEAAMQAGVTHILNVGIDDINFAPLLATAKRFPQVYASYGFHPTEPGPMPDFEVMCERASDAKVVMIGETGLDYYHQEVAPETQQQHFRNMIRLAKHLHKPLIIHTRQAQEDTIRILQEEQANTVGGIFHCFTESLEMAQQGLDLGFLISFSGIITFKNAASLREVVRYVPLESLLIETDAPWLAPMPFRGKTNRPEYVRYVAQAVADIKECAVEKVIQQTSRNFLQLIGQSPAAAL